MRDKINTALIELISESVVFLEATRERALDVLFNLVTVSMETINTMSWLLCFTINRRPSLLIPRLHQYLIYSLKIHQNPLLDTTVEHCTDDQKKLVALGAKTFGYLLKHQNALVRKSVIDLFEEYFGQMKDQDTAMESNPESFVKDDLQRYYLGYIFVLPKISPELIEACWTEMFKKLFQNDSAGTMFMYERESEYSRICTPSGEHSIVSVFPQWLSNVAFSKDSLIMKHALDVAVMLDTMAYDPRLNLGHLIPAGDKSILDSMRPSFEQLDLQPSSIDLVDWTISILESKSHVRGVDSLKIALFLMQLLIFKCDTEEEAAKMLVSIITQLDKPNVKPESSTGTRYLVLNLVASAETKWPNVFQVVLEKIFSHAIALHIADSEGSVSVEKILANLAMLFEETDEAYGLDGIRPGFSAFQTYIVDHWQQVLLLFVSHPSMECRAMGYRVLANSKLWKHTGANVQPIQISKMLTEAWFRHMKHRFLRITPQEREEEVSVLEELERLIVGCCQTLVLAKSILCLALDFIMQGALEIFPPVDPNVLQREKTSLLDKVRENKPAMEIRSQINRPPQFITMTNLFNGELDFRDKTYIDNIQRTARLFYSFRDSKETTREHTIAVSLSILSHLTSKWPRQKVSLEAYDNVLPKNIPYASDITTGNAFKDHPALFLIIEQCSAITTSPISDTTRSILVYFIAFWHMPEVAKETMTLKYATQLEETSRIMILLNSVIVFFFHNQAIQLIYLVNSISPCPSNLSTSSFRLCLPRTLVIFFIRLFGPTLDGIRVLQTWISLDWVLLLPPLKTPFVLNQN
ncbi:hypothetical protein CLU79DRAFT_744317 [Phycomyces nitens]|nr:hypothetical protein CLU79DRAFT_744317 [Phycomyces nitens]